MIQSQKIFEAKFSMGEGNKMQTGDKVLLEFLAKFDMGPKSQMQDMIDKAGT
jgi:hypothetical protein